MRFRTLVLAGLLSLGLCAPSHAADVATQKVENISIELPDDWQLLPKAMLEQLSQGKHDILLLAQGPSEGFPKLSILKNPDPISQADFAKLDESRIDAMCKQFNGNVEQQFGKKVKGTCNKVENDGVGALAVQVAIPAQGKRPELVSITWNYPNAAHGVVVSAMFPKKDAGKYEAVIKKACESLKFIK